jgi:hypothetical protein
MILECKRTRRQFLIDATGAFLAIPFLSSLSPLSEAEATSTTASKFVSIYLRNGYHGAHFYPQIARNTMKPITSTTLEADLPPVISPVMGNSFTALRDNILIYRGLDYLCAGEAGHNDYQFLLSQPVPQGGIFSLSNSSPSIDYHIANQVYGNSTPFQKILNTSIDWRNSPITYSFSNVVGNSFSMNGSGFRDVNPLWTSIFEGNQGTVAEELRKKTLDTNVVDSVLDGYNNLRRNSQLSNADRILLDQHISHLSDLEKNIKNMPLNLCRGPDKSSIPYGEGLSTAYRNATRAMIDIMVATISCGLTKVVNFSLNPDTIFRSIAPYNYGHHDISHGTTVNEALGLSVILAELFDHIAYFISRLKEVGALTGLVGIIGNEIGNQSQGSDGTPQTPTIDQNHAGIDLMCVLFGDPSILNTGKYVHYERGIRGGRWHNGYGAGWNEALVTIMDLFAVPPSAYEVPGAVGFGTYSTGANFGLTNADIVSPNTLRGKPLAGIKAK